jgi:hypothetical protein
MDLEKVHSLDQEPGYHGDLPSFARLKDGRSPGNRGRVMIKD